MRCETTSRQTREGKTQFFVSADLSVYVKLYLLDRFYLQAMRKSTHLNLRIDTKRYRRAE
jgi:hypothetical protein